MEVFSRPFFADIPAGKSGEGTETYPVMAPEQVQRLFRQQLPEICSHFDAFSRPVGVLGIIGEVSTDQWRRRKATPLLDQRTGTALLLDLPPSLLEGDGLHPGEFVRVWGVLRARLHQGQLVPRFEVFSITRDREQTLLGQVDRARQILSHTMPQRRDFPARARGRMLLLGVGVGKKRLESLKPLLGGFWQESDITLRSITGEEEADLISLPGRMEQDILFLVFGEDVWPGLDADGLLQALLRCPAYRILACEGRNDGLVFSDDVIALMVAHVVERFFTLPTEAAGYIRQRTAEIRQQEHEERARQEELAALRSSMAALVGRPAEGGRPPAFLVLLAGGILGVGLCLACWWVLHQL